VAIRARLRPQFPERATNRNGENRTDLMFVFLLTLLSAVALMMWCHYRRDDASQRRIGRRI
jgi:hypothetical protein